MMEELDFSNNQIGTKAGIEIAKYVEYNDLSVVVLNVLRLIPLVGFVVRAKKWMGITAQVSMASSCDSSEFICDD